MEPSRPDLSDVRDDQSLPVSKALPWWDRSGRLILALWFIRSRSRRYRCHVPHSCPRGYCLAGRPFAASLPDPVKRTESVSQSLSGRGKPFTCGQVQAFTFGPDSTRTLLI